MDAFFAWDPSKNLANVRKHGIAFIEAITAFSDPFSLTIPDPDHSILEERYLLLGQMSSGRLVVVAHVEIGNEIRIISARPATRRERHAYEEEP